jgi:homoaconitate hydratase
MPQTLIEKIAQRFAFGLPAGQTVRAGDFLSIRPAHCMTHDNTDAVIPKFKSIGAKKVHDPRQPVFALDHDIQNKLAENLAKYAKIEAFAKEHGIDFYPAGRGIGHQIVLEEGYALPGTFVVASDSHSNIYGALGALGTPVVRTDAAAIWSTGRTWWQVPEIVKVNLRGKLAPGVAGKDVIITLIGVFNKDEVLNCCLEFAGPGVAALSIEERMTISNMTTEWGVLAAVFPYDEVTRNYLLSRAEVFKQRGDPHPRLTPAIVERMEKETPKADADAAYAKEIDFDLSAVAPFVAGPNEVKTIASAAELEAKNVRIDKAFLMSCVNGRLQDFARAAEVIRGRKVAPHVKFYIAAASSEVEEQAKAKGYWQVLMDAGAIALPAGCGACIGLGEGVLTDGEVGISATNRNFDGRMGSRKSQVYLASPGVVAASAVAGKIAVPKPSTISHQPVAADPRVGRDAVASAPRGRRDSVCGAGVSPVARDTGETPVPQKVIRVSERKAAAAKVEILPGFPASMSGELLFAPKDNLNTDGIYGKEYTYKTLPPEEMGKAAMANYDPEFQNLARTGDILVGAFNFGCGSSREQAATALKFRGLQLIVAGSFSQTYSRNAYNNGYVCIECPKLVEELKAAFQQQAARTIRTGWQATIDFTRSQIAVAADPRVGRGEERTYTFPALGPVAQELVIKGGFEAVIRDQLATMK